MIFFYFLRSDHKFRSLALCRFLNDPRNADLMISEYFCDTSQYTVCVFHLHPQEKLILHFIKCFDRFFFIAGAADPTVAVIFQISRHIDHISHDRARCRQFSCPSAIKHRVVHRISVHKHCIERIPDRCKRMIFMEHHRIYADFDPFVCVSRNTEQFDHTVKFPCIFNVFGCDLSDSLCIHIVKNHS